MSNPAEDIEKDIRKEQRRQQQLINEKTEADKADLEEKRNAVFRERLNIINAERGQIWSPSGDYKPIQPKSNSNLGVQ